MERRLDSMIGQLRRAGRPGHMRPGVSILAGRFLSGLLASVIIQPAFAADIVQAANSGGAGLAHAGTLTGSPFQIQPEARHSPAQANFEREAASQDVHHLADRIIETTDNHLMPFVIVDKVDARVYVFDADGKLRGAAPALLGLAVGDDPAAGIRDHKLSDIGPKMRVTPAGRFVASLGHDSAGKEILWVDYRNSIALHPVVTSHPKERRLQRLASPLPLEHRISWGCINVPKKFYESVVNSAFAGTRGIVYVLPETRPAREVFGFD